MAANRTPTPLDIPPDSWSIYGPWPGRRQMRLTLAESSDALAATIPVPLALVEPSESVPYTFSPVAPGYFLPSPGWAKNAKQSYAGAIMTYAPSPRMLVWSAQHVHNLLVRARIALGDVFPEILQADFRALKSRTPPPMRHRLAEIYRLVSPLIYFYTPEARPFIDPMTVAELHAIVAILERAAREPIWHEIRPSCADASNFLHTMITFLSVEMLERTQHLVHPTLSTSFSGREPDIKIDIGVSVHLEVKVPRILVRTPQTGGAAITKDMAARIVEKIAAGAVGSSGQIRFERPGMLVIGGFSFRGDEVSELEMAARSYIERRGKRYPFLTAVGITGMMWGRNPSLFGAARAMPGFNFVHNPYARIRFP